MSLEVLLCTLSGVVVVLDISCSNFLLLISKFETMFLECSKSLFSLLSFIALIRLLEMAFELPKLIKFQFSNFNLFVLESI